MLPASKFLLTATLVVACPGLVAVADAHGGAYRGPPGEIPPNSREPSDPPPPPDGSGPTTGGEGGGGPVTGDGDIGGGPNTGDGDPGGGPTTDGPSSGPDQGGGGPGGGPRTGPLGGARPRGPGYAGWTFWWNFNKDEILALRQVRHAQGASTGHGPHVFSRQNRATAARSVTQASIDETIVPELRKLLTKKGLHFDIQSAAAIALAKAGDTGVVSELIAMARNEGGSYHRIVEESGALALGILGEGTDDVRDALIDLAGDTSRNASRVRPFAAISLGLIGDDADGRSREALLALVTDDDASGDVKPSALLALGLLGDDAAVEPLLDLIGPRKRGEVELSDMEMPFAIEALGRIGAPGTSEQEDAVVEALTDRLTGRRAKSEVKNVRRSAVIALGGIAPQTEGKQLNLIVQTLSDIAATSNADDSERAFALVTLGRIAEATPLDTSDRRRVVRVLREQLEEGRPGYLMRPFAALGIGLVGRGDLARGDAPDEENLRNPLRKALMDDGGDAKTRGGYAIAAGLLRDQLAVDTLVEIVGDGGANDMLRGQSAVALGMIGDHSARDTVREALTTGTDRDLRIRAAIGSGLLGDPEAVDYMVGVLESNEMSQYMLGSCALALGKIGDERAIQPLLDVVLDENNSRPDITRALATVALGQLADRRDVPALALVSRDINFRATGVSPALFELLSIL